MRVLLVCDFGYETVSSLHDVLYAIERVINVADDINVIGWSWRVIT